LKTPELKISRLQHLKSPELEARLLHLQETENQGEGFLKVDWIWLLILGVLGPIGLIIWGWVS
jgi:hypothetical protein